MSSEVVVTEKAPPTTVVVTEKAASTILVTEKSPPSTVVVTEKEKAPSSAVIVFEKAPTSTIVVTEKPPPSTILFSTVGGKPIPPEVRQMIIPYLVEPYCELDMTGHLSNPFDTAILRVSRDTTTEVLASIYRGSMNVLIEPWKYTTAHLPALKERYFEVEEKAPILAASRFRSCIITVDLTERRLSPAAADDDSNNHIWKYAKEKALLSDLLMTVVANVEGGMPGLQHMSIDTLARSLPPGSHTTMTTTMQEREEEFLSMVAGFLAVGRHPTPSITITLNLDVEPARKVLRGANLLHAVMSRIALVGAAWGYETPMAFFYVDHSQPAAALHRTRVRVQEMEVETDDISLNDEASALRLEERIRIATTPS